MITTVKIAVALSGLVYRPWPAVSAALVPMGMDMVCEPFDVGGAQGMLVMGHGEAFLVFRGTEASDFRIGDLLANVGWPVAWDGSGRAHSGYAAHFANIRVPARDFAERIPAPIPLYVTGHSMGGVLATLYAAWVGSGGPDDHRLAGLLTFGAPKGLDGDGLSTIACPVRRYVNRWDLIGPPWPPVPGLRHPEGKVVVDSGGWIGPVTRHGDPRYARAVR